MCWKWFIYGNLLFYIFRIDAGDSWLGYLPKSGYIADNRKPIHDKEGDEHIAANKCELENSIGRYEKKKKLMINFMGIYVE